MGFEDKIKEGAGSGIQAIKDGTNVVFSEVSKLLKISEKRIDINSYKKKIEKNYTTLGELVHRYLTDGVTNPLDQADVREVLQNIYKYNERIQELQSEIEIIKSMKPEQMANGNNQSEPAPEASEKEEGNPFNETGKQGERDEPPKPENKPQESSPNPE